MASCSLFNVVSLMALPLTKTQSPRETRQRTAIRKAFHPLHRLLSVKEVLELAAQEVPGIGVATIYRNLRSMVDAGELVSVDLPGEPPRYALPGQPRDVVFLCARSGQAFAFAAPTDTVEQGLPAGFVAQKTLVIIRGTVAAEA